MISWTLASPANSSRKQTLRFITLRRPQKYPSFISGRTWNWTRSYNLRILLSLHRGNRERLGKTEGSDEKAECNWMSDGECVWGIHVVRAADDYRLQCYKKFDKWKVTDGFNVCSLGFVRQIDSSMGELSDRAASHGENPRILADNSTDGLRGSKSKSFARGRQLYARQTNIVIIVLSILPCSPYTVLRGAGQSFTLLDSSSSLLVFRTNQNVHLGL